MLYSLPDGRVINMDLETYLSMSDGNIKDLSCDVEGDHINNPFYGSTLKAKSFVLKDDINISALDVDKVPFEQKLEETQDDYFSDT